MSTLTDAEQEAITSAAYHALGTHRIQPHGDELHERLGSAVEAIVDARVRAAKAEARREERLACALTAGHDGDHAAAVVETLQEAE